MKPVATIAKKRRPKKLDLVPSVEAVALFFYPRDHADAMDLLSIRHWALGIRKRIFWPSKLSSRASSKASETISSKASQYRVRFVGTSSKRGEIGNQPISAQTGAATA
jgi:hypothetical protein